MKKPYLNSKYSEAKKFSIKQKITTVIAVFLMTFAFGQSKITIITDSNYSLWDLAISNPSTFLDWTATGPGINLTETATNTPSFNLTPNAAFGDVTIETTGTPANFAGITFLKADNGVGLRIKSIDVSDLTNLARLDIDDNTITTLDLSNNPNLMELNVNRNALVSLDLSANAGLLELYVDANLDLVSLDLSNNINLETLSATSLILVTTLDFSNNTELIDVDLSNVPLTSASIDGILNDLDSFGKSNGKLNLQNTSGGVITKDGIGAYISLLTRGWTIVPPQGFDFGDAPDSYGTLISSGGAIHLNDPFHDELRLGASKDYESNGFPGVDADGDDTDQFDDEDGVDQNEFNGISDSSTNIDINIDLTSNFDNASYLHAWIDFDGNGSFDSDEYSTLVIAANSGQATYVLNWDLIALGADIVNGQTYARFRFTKDNTLTASDPIGYATGGEVEDYTLIIQLDTDKDGIPDSSDLDADNDGILNTDEVGDTNGNGIDDMLELESDDDACFDVTEAGFTDGDGDGILGTSPVVVDANGLITDDALGPIGDGFTTPNDLDNNSVYDFQEAGLAATITTEPTDQDLIIGTTTFTVVATADTYKWQEDQGAGFVDIVDGGDYAGAMTAALQVTNSDVTKLLYRYQVIVNNIAFACDPTTTSIVVGYITPDDFDLDGVFDLVDLDDDNDGILDTVENQGGVIDIDTDGDGNPDRIDLDADGDGCFDVDENLYDNNGINQVGNQDPAVVDIDGVVTSLGANGGYGVPEDQNGSGTPDFQEVGTPATITTQPTDQDLIIGVSTFSVVAVADVYQWQEDKQDGNGFVDLVDGGDYSGTDTADLQVTNSDVSKLTYRYLVVVSNISFVCDATTSSVDVGYLTPEDFDLDGVFDIVDVDDDNDGILDVTEDNGVIDRDTDGNGAPDRIDLDADGDFCLDVTEAGFTDGDGNGELGSAPVTVDAFGQVTSGVDGYTAPNDLNLNTIADFQEIGTTALITSQPTDQIYDIVVGSTVFTVNTDAVVGDAVYQWQESLGGVGAWTDISNTGGYSGATTDNLTVPSPADYSNVFNIYRVIVSNIAYACDPTTTSIDAGFIIPGDFDLDGVFDIVDVDDDNDGILDTVEDDGVIDRDTDGDGSPDRIDLDSDADFCFDVLEAGFEENGRGELGNSNPAVVDATGRVISATDGYTAPNDLDLNGVPDFQETGSQAAITLQPSDQPLMPGNVTFSVVADADTLQWQEDRQDGSGFVDIIDGGEYSGATTTELVIAITDASKYSYEYQVIVNNVAFACGVAFNSIQVGFIQDQIDTDKDGVFDDFDVDDDNDGIFDTVEGITTDSNGNGIPDRMELDADGDLCFDVIEAGFEDNGQGELGNSIPVVVDANGQVISATDGYTTPADLDGNGIYDFQEAGTPSIITVPPQDITIEIGDDATFEVFGTATFYQWQLYDAINDVWNNIADDAVYSGTNSSELILTSPTDTFDGNIYRVQLTSPDYICDPNPILNSESAELNINVFDADNDGVPDAVDVDDDNDGILDVAEYDGLPPLTDSGEPVPPEYDTDNDGVANQFDLDSDDDICFDVTEAGFTDNGFGLLGTQNPPIVDATGRVTSATDGYTTPNDLDGNGIPDFREFGVGGSIDSQPQFQEFELGGSATFSVVGVGGAYQWQVSIDGLNWTDLSDSGQYSGTISADMTVSDLEIDNYYEFYRVILSNIALVCDLGETSVNASYDDLLDTDNDGVFDIVDVDDDNDGIFDTVEGEFTDSNLDGIPDRISLDADGDTCADVLEAGFEDSDGDGVLGISPVTVDADGKVIDQQGGYTTPNDLDGNGVFDFQEAGSASVINNQPEDAEITLGTDATFEVDGDATFFQWETSLDGGVTWSVLFDSDQFEGTNTDRLRVYEAYGLLESSLYRVVLSSPDYACDPNLLLVSEAAMLSFNTELIPSGFSPNGDGSNDFFEIPGLDQFPDFKIDIFNRYGSKVYSYDNNGSSNPEWWDGYSTGSMQVGDGRVPVGTYFYALYFNGDGESPQSGWVYVNY